MKKIIINEIVPRIFIKQLIILFFFYMLLEGILRKWIFPNLSTQIYFIKDIFLIIIYIIALKYNLIINSKFSKLLIILVIMISLWGFIGYGFSKVEIVSYILGLRSYWLFLPLFLIIVHTCDKNDLAKFINLNLYFILPMFILIYLQTILPATSVINSGYGNILMNPERPSGYFTYTTQNTYYFLFLFFCFCSHVMNKKKISNKDIIILSLINFLLLSTMILLKSRAVYFYVFVTIIYSSFFLIISNLQKNLKFKKLLLILLVSYVSFFSGSKIFFEKEYTYSEFRMNSDTYYQMELVLDNDDTEMFFSKESIPTFCAKNSSLCRVIDELYFFPALYRSSFYGEGIGAGTSLVTKYNNMLAFILGEQENKRVVMELGNFVGFIFVVSKIVIIIFLNFFAILKFRVEQNLIYLPILVFISVQMLLGPITYTTSFISFSFWFSLGLLLTSFDKINKKYN